MSDDSICPSPLVPPEVDLRDFPFMPVDIVRLFNSEFHAQADDAAWRAGFTLWLKSYHQVPAASIPDDDVALARLAELGRDVKGWKRIRTMALRGWVKCSDGRLYHPVVAEKALEGWIQKIAQRKASAAGNASRYDLPFDPKPFEDADAQCRGFLATLTPQSRLLLKRPKKLPARLPVGGDTAPGGSADGSADGTPDALPSGSQETGTGTGTGTGTSKGYSDLTVGDTAPPKGPPGVDDEPLDDPKKALYARSDQVVGRGSGGMTTKLLQAKGGSVPRARAAIEEASVAHNPREYLSGVIRKGGGSSNGELYDRGL